MTGRRGVMIAVEGVDGGGKSGVVASLTDALRKDGHDVVATREPGGTDAGVALRQLLLSSNAYDWTPVSELLLINAARRQHVERVIAPALANGQIVLCDRFVGSTLAYQGAGRGLSADLIRELHRLTIDDLWPDLTLVLDVDPEAGLKRSRSRLVSGRIDEGRFEALDLAFHTRVRQSFLEQAEAAPAIHTVIDASRAPAEAQADALARVREMLAKRAAT